MHIFINEANALLHRPNSLPKNRESIKMTIASLQSLVQAWSVDESAQSYGISNENLASPQETVRCAQDCIDICTRIYSTLQGSDKAPSGN
jgi:hypothetical protein